MIRKAFRVIVRGTVQGVGFRPFIYRLASRLGYSGFVRNIGEGVEIYLEKEDGQLEEFLESLKNEAPPLARIEGVDYQPVEPLGRSGFEIDRSSQEKSFVFISPDIATCQDCLQEIEDPEERRYRYPFTNCTNCGPRYTIVRQLPYDRRQTTMSGFRMCRDCRREYQDPLDRRYHAQPIACPRCGPELSLLEARTGRKLTGGLEQAVRLIRQGKVLAVKGLGGFHLVCLATDQKAIKRLRQIKRRQTKPLALMARDLKTVRKYAQLNPDEKSWLTSPARPIVLLKKKRELPGIAPFIDTVGIMLPYTPLHHLLLKDLPLIVATSSNRKDAPIIKDDSLVSPGLCDYILTHNREIAMRADDSVIKVVNGKPVFLRRARGFVPFPQAVPESLQNPVQILAVGGELKNTISIYKNGYIITSQFLGDLDDYENFRYFEETLNHLKKLFSFRPELVVSDLHPDFWSTRYARNLKIPHLQVQHHFAHSLAPLIEHQLPPGEKFLGVSWDGFGYGDDGQAWGGEFLLADYDGYERYAHFDYVPLPGGDVAAREPWRMALSHLYRAFGENFPCLRPLASIPESRLRPVRLMIERKINSPLTSSAGRLFDAVAYICGLAPARVEYEAEAPSRLEAAASRVRSKRNQGYSFSVRRDSRPYRVDFSQTIDELVLDLKKKVRPELAAWKFHLTLVQLILEMAVLARKEHGLNRVVLTGGVFLNRLLTEQTERVLMKNGFEVLRPVFYSPGDESLSLGQIAYALNRVKKGEL
ncbi:MAG: [NiFe] hydrogenase metallocenter assembly protein HypF [Candidatus Saccharicenans subterraneus]|uniref:Carbamoyltransferase n=1 Tax=Candidatus Saccharicenans subterraneus TaxID=2508984 RepID=A0A3E2BPE6_9BACT|nr:MAG: [NiFe] hydrogenase metallocenter assembly protein HypF [Candidatus Saccharicenans subterraneum]